MSKKDIYNKVDKFAAILVEEKGYVSPVDLLLSMGRLKPSDIENWRFGRLPYLERATLGNLSKMNTILSALQDFAKSNGLKASPTVYKSWGKGPKRLLRFSKSGNPKMESTYSTHYMKGKDN